MNTIQRINEFWPNVPLLANPETLPADVRQKAENICSSAGILDRTEPLVNQLVDACHLLLDDEPAEVDNVVLWSYGSLLDAIDENMHGDSFFEEFVFPNNLEVSCAEDLQKIAIRNGFLCETPDAKTAEMAMNLYQNALAKLEEE